MIRGEGSRLQADWLEATLDSGPPRLRLAPVGRDGGASGMIGGVLGPRDHWSSKSLRGWAIWAAAVAIMLPLNGIVWTLVAAC